jgi:hypothetical protein
VYKYVFESLLSILWKFISRNGIAQKNKQTTRTTKNKPPKIQTLMVFTMENCIYLYILVKNDASVHFRIFFKKGPCGQILTTVRTAAGHHYWTCQRFCLLTLK